MKQKSIKIKNPKGTSLDEWANINDFEGFREEVKIHIENLCPSDLTEEDVDGIARCIMISLRQRLS